VALWREALPDATVVLDWWHVAVRHEHALQTTRGLGVGTADTQFADEAIVAIDRAKWRRWRGHWTGCRRKPAGLYRWSKRKHVREVAGIDRLQRHISELRGYLERNEAHWCSVQPGVGVVDQSRPRSWRLGGQRDRGQANEPEATEALEQGNRAALPRCTRRRAKSRARGRVSISLPRFSFCQR
jgi:hypothetical protein